MNEQPHSRAPLIGAIVLLLLPVLYVGSYFALVVPSGRRVPAPRASYKGHWNTYYYRLDSTRAGQFFWPLEQIDRKMRPGAWRSSSFLNDHRSLQIEKSLGGF